MTSVKTPKETLIEDSILNNTYRDDTSSSSSTSSSTSSSSTNNTIRSLITDLDKLIDMFASSYQTNNTNTYEDTINNFNTDKTNREYTSLISEFNTFICSKLQFEFASDGGNGDCLFDAISIRLYNKLDKTQSLQIRQDIVDYEIVSIASLVDF